jgi:hypothetical protein
VSRCLHKSAPVQAKFLQSTDSLSRNLLPLFHSLTLLLMFYIPTTALPLQTFLFSPIIPSFLIPSPPPPHHPAANKKCVLLILFSHLHMILNIFPLLFISLTLVHFHTFLLATWCSCSRIYSIQSPPSTLYDRICWWIHRLTFIRGRVLHMDENWKFIWNLSGQPEVLKVYERPREKFNN